MWLAPHATSFEAECEACRVDRWSVAADLAHVAGSLRAEADVGFCSCRRGHRLVVRRIFRPDRAAVVLRI
ncbi:MAG: hypothetical protein ACR2MU_05515 [Gaiellaceae bacterium]